MPYKVQSSEKLRKSGADFETKAMLYLLNFREDSSQINYFVVDFFNDITGMDRMARKLWDVDGVNLLSVSELQKYTLIKVLNFSIILLSFLCHVKIL